MKNKIIKSSFIFVAFLMMPSFVWAAPSDIAVSGTVTHDSVVTINGTGFGIKSPVAPYFFDNFESGTVGNAVHGNSGTVGAKTWVNYEGIAGAVYRNDQYYGRGSKSAGIGPVAADSFATVGINGLDSTTAYYSVRYRVSMPNMVAGAVYKPIRIAGTPGYYGTDPRFYIQMSTADSYTYAAVRDVNGNYPDGIQDGVTSITREQWNRSESYFKLGASSDAVAKHWWNGALDYNKSGFTTGTSNTIGSFLLPFEIANGSVFNIAAWADDVYFDNTQARVEICNQNTKVASTVCEIQIPQNIWTDNGQLNGAQLEIRVNQGSFADGDPVYLYVIDANGDVNASGSPVFFGSAAGDTIAPSAPSGLSVM